MAVFLASPQHTFAVACPTPGAKVRVCVNNPTGSPQTVYVAGTAANNEITCTGPAPILGAYEQEFVAAAGIETCQDLPTTGGLLTGMYVHRIYDSPKPPPGPSPTPRAAQYQKGPVVGGAQSQWTKIDWTFHKTIFTVNSTADSACSDANCQAASCTLRQAINKAGSNPVPERPVLITVIDEYTREALAIDVAGSIRSARVIEVLAQLVSVHGAPHTLRSDNGPEFVSRAILRWLTDAGIHCVLSDPGKPWQNGTDESFNGKLRDECLSMEWFRNRQEAVALIETWRRHYNEVRPHSSLDYLTPIEFKMRTAKTTTPPAEAVSH